MNEKVDELYNGYLKEKLDLVFEVKELNNTKEKGSEITINTDNYGNYYFVNQETGNVTRLIGYDQVWVLRNGSAKVKKYGKYNYIDGSGRVLYDTWFDDIREVDWYLSGNDNKRSIVRIRGKYNLIDAMGNILCNEWYDEMSSFLGENNPALIRKGGEYNYINTDGKLISDKWFDDASMFQESGYAVVAIGDMYNVIDKEGKYLFNWKKQYISNNIIKISKKFIEVKFGSDNNKGTLVCVNKDLKGYKVGKILNVYNCSNNIDKFKIKYEPIKIIDNRNVLCLSNNKIYLYDRTINKYQELGIVSDIEYDDNFIYDNKNGIVYFIYNENMYDITSYYNNYIKTKEIVKINKDVGRILTRVEFSALNDAEIRKKYQEEQEENKKILKMREERDNKIKLEQANREKERQKKEIKFEQDSIMDQISGCIQLLGKLEKEFANNRKIFVDNIFVEVGDHKEIISFFIQMSLLKYIDLKGETFENVKLSGIDFRGCNISLNPQLVYKKDLSNCNFEGVTISPFMNFNGVDIRGSKFSQASIPGIIDEKNTTFKHAIYDENTTYNGVPFTQIYGECDYNKGRKM